MKTLILFFVAGTALAESHFTTYQNDVKLITDNWQVQREMSLFAAESQCPGYCDPTVFVGVNKALIHSPGRSGYEVVMETGTGERYCLRVFVPLSIEGKFVRCQ